ncbi:hypothetical protein KCP75_03875 [Salmonella enterica subsp. enterica]|nr:hypothetical protein KCP75_03875 [Salmonella enterica subsp. enterica]
MVEACTVRAFCTVSPNQGMSDRGSTQNARSVLNRALLWPRRGEGRDGLVAAQPVGRTGRAAKRARRRRSEINPLTPC